MRFKDYLNEISFKGYLKKQEISKPEINRFVSDINSKIKQYGATFTLTNHFVNDRINDPRNNPPLTLAEIEWVMRQWFKENETLFKKDVENVKNNIAKPRGENKKQIPFNNLEWTASGKIKDRNFVHVVFALRQDREKKGTAILLPQTIIRTKNKKVTKGEYYQISGELNLKG